MDLKGKTAVVKGGAEGIGYSIAEKFIEKSAHVIILDINDVKGKEAVHHLENKAVFIKCDLRRDLETVWKEIIEKYKRIDILVNNAGIGDADFQSAIHINFTASVSLSLKFYEHASSNGGTIINVSSILGYRVAPFVPVYQATKAGMIAFSRSLGHKKNFDKSNVKVIALCPGFTKTSAVKALLEANGSFPGDLVTMQSLTRGKMLIALVMRQ